MLESVEYDPLDWTMDLILELTEEQWIKLRTGVSWRTILDTLDALDWPRGAVEEIIDRALETGALYEPVLGNLRLADHDIYMGRQDGEIYHDEIQIHYLEERLPFKKWIRERREAWDKRKAEPSLIDMRILQIPQHVGEEILGILKTHGITATTVTTRPSGGIS